MGKAILICGRICSGKSTYAERLREKENAVILSADEIMLSFFDRQLGDQHEVIAAKVEGYLKKKALDILATGTSIILDWGFWTATGRRENRAYFESRGFACEMHCVEISGETWQRNIDRRNAQVLAGRSDVYLVDEGLKCKIDRLFEQPQDSEIDVWYTYP